MKLVQNIKNKIFQKNKMYFSDAEKRYIISISNILSESFSFCIDERI